MRAPTLALCLALATLAAGCFSNGATAPVEPSAPPAVDVDENRPEPTFGDIPQATLGSVAAPDLNATLAAPPKLVPGEWWRIHFSSPLTGEETEFVRVVAKAEDDGTYVVGMPHEAWYKEAVIYHTPAFGDVNADLSYHAHDVPFVPLKFPLEDGASWETHWENGNVPLTATVTVEDASTARIVFTGPQCGVQAFLGPCPEGSAVGTVIELVYDAKLHEVRELDIPGQLRYEVLEHGYGFEGWVTVPRGEDLVFFHGRIGASTVDLSFQPAPPIETVTIEGGFNRLSFILLAGSFVGSGGAYSEKVTAPDGTVYEKTSIPGGPITIDFLEATNPDGEWQLEHLVAGPGFAFVEGIAYHQYDVHLPDGRIRTDHSHAVVR